MINHKADREGAKGDIEEATVLRNKEEAAYSAEKAMGGAALLQMPSGDRLKKIVSSYPNMDSSDRREAMAFLEDSSESTGASDQIVGILKAMKDDMEAELKEAIAAEEKAVAGYADLKGSKEKEIEMATEAIETKMGRAGDVAVSAVQTKDSLEDTKDELADTQKFITQLASE